MRQPIQIGGSAADHEGCCAVPFAFVKPIRERLKGFFGLLDRLDLLAQSVMIACSGNTGWSADGRGIRGGSRGHGFPCHPGEACQPFTDQLPSQIQLLRRHAQLLFMTCAAVALFGHCDEFGCRVGQLGRLHQHEQRVGRQQGLVDLAGDDRRRDVEAGPQARGADVRVFSSAPSSAP